MLNYVVFFSRLKCLTGIVNVDAWIRQHFILALFLSFARSALTPFICVCVCRILIISGESQIVGITNNSAVARSTINRYKWDAIVDYDPTIVQWDKSEAFFLINQLKRIVVYYWYNFFPLSLVIFALSWCYSYSIPCNRLTAYNMRYIHTIQMHTVWISYRTHAFNERVRYFGLQFAS